MAEREREARPMPGGADGQVVTGAELRQRFRGAASSGGCWTAPDTEPRVLSDGELEFFRVEGYIVLEGLMDHDLCRRAVDGIFACAGATGLRLDQNDPSTWMNPFQPEDEDEENEGNYVSTGIGHRWHLREVGGEELIVSLLPRRCLAIAQQLVGDSVAFPSGGEPTAQRTAALQSCFAPNGRRCRGVYSSFPAYRRAVPPNERVPLRDQPDRGHYDTQALDDSMTPARFMATGLLGDTPPGCGGFTVFPRSHRRLHQLASECRDKGINPVSAEGTARRDALVEEIAADTEPVDCFGPAGTVVLWHRATMHKVATNYSQAIRFGCIYDFLSSEQLGNGQAWDTLGLHADAWEQQRGWVGPAPALWERWRGDGGLRIGTREEQTARL